MDFNNIEKTGTFVFIYEKEQIKKVFNLEDSIKYHNKLVKNGWKHTETLDCCLYLESILNDTSKTE